MEIKKTEQEIQKSIDALIESALAEETTSTEEVKTETTEEVVKSEEQNKTEETVVETIVETKEEVVVKAEKEDESAEEEMEEGASEEADKKVKAHEKKMHKKMKKSLGDLSEDEIELVLAWRAQASSSEEEIEKEVKKSLVEENSANIADEIKKAIADSTSDLRKSLEEKDSLIKSLGDKIEKLSNQPAYTQRGIQNLEVIEKSDSNSVELDKKVVLNKMLDLQVAGKGVDPKDVAEFESTGNISNIRVKNLVMESLK